MRRALAIVAAAAGLISAACGGTEGAETTTAEQPAVAAVPTFVGADGVESRIEDTSRIVTLSGDLTEAVFELGLGASVVATDVTTIYPPEATQLPIVGVGRFLTAEGVLRESPTLVLGDTQTSPPEAIAQIRSAGVPVVIFDVPTGFDALYAKARAIGEVLGVPDEGERLAQRLEDAISGAVAEAPALNPAPSVAFIYSRGPDVMLLFGEGMTTQPVIEAAGGKDAGVAAGVTGTVNVTPEALVAAAPDVIVTTSEGLDALGGVGGMLAIPGFAETPAGRSGRILAYPEGDFLTFGPRIADSLGAFIADLRNAMDQ
ncbi:MAG: ABC transporter substrate-binding protein [Acidimicrobiia bacterium]|nr:ABC transporter substrate-binding protein [Acidimicrobiia bacterium]